MRLRLGDVTTNTQKLTVVSTSMSTVTATCSGGSVAISTLVDRYNNGGKSIGVATITISGLSPWTKYTYSVTQGSEIISGGFRTLMDNQTTDFSLIFATCEKELGRDTRDAFRQIKRVMIQSETDNIPVATMLHIDDLAYFDRLKVNDPITGIVSTNFPELSGVARDYAAAYGAYYGLFTTHAKFQMADRQYVYQNLALAASGGDHLFEGNHCRGGFGNSDYAGCNRGATGDVTGTGYSGAVPNLEATAKAEWDAFVGNANPPVLRSGKLHWGKVIGAIRFGLFDYSLYSNPYDPVTPDVNLIGYGAEQLADIRGYMNTPTEPFKCFMHESGCIGYGQPWRDWHPNEADTWKTEFDGTANYMTTATSWSIYGDNHQPHVVKNDTFWSFCAGVLQDSAMVIAPETEGAFSKLLPWAAQLLWQWASYTITGGRVGGGFWHFKVYASESPKRITAVFIDSGNGVERSPTYTLLEGSLNNQWTKDSIKFG